MLVVMNAKTLHHSFIPTFTKTLNQFFYLSSTNRNLETRIPI